MSPDGLTRETPAPGLVVYQPRRGFRYAMDPFLLSGWVLERQPPATALDVCTGSGIAALLLASQGVAAEALDIRPEWVGLVKRSAAESGLHLPTHCADVRHFRPDRCWELVICNPPYLPANRGMLPADPVKAHARHELAGGLGEIVVAMARLGRRLALVLPLARAQEAELALAAVDRPLRARCDVGPLCLIEGSLAGGAPTRESVPMREGEGYGSRVRGWYARVGASLA